jgi:RepB plasmid partitioning protein/ParB-like nuclease domain
MTKPIRMAFERQIVTLSIAALLPRKVVPNALKRTVKYKRIARSIAEVGLVEPVVVSRLSKPQGDYLLLDGHLRVAALRDTGQQEVRCLVADDDEAFTYNKRVNRLATVQEHLMIVRAIKRGVSEEKLARALNLDVKLIKRRRTLLDGICPEVVELLKDRSINPVTFDVLRRMKPFRQMEAVELMATAGNWSSSYAKALLAATKQEELAKSHRPKKIVGMSSEQMARMERELASLHRDFKQIEASYGDDILHLVIACGYLTRLVANPEIDRFLAQHHPEMRREFHSIIAAASLDESPGLAA